MRTLAARREALAVAAAWGVAEALWWPLVPDLPVAVLALAVPRRWWRVALLAAAGSVTGGVAAYLLGAHGQVPPLPLVTPRMRAVAAAQLRHGALGLRHQPLSGIPFKVYAYQAAPAGAGIAAFTAVALLARGARLLAVAAVAAAAGWALWRWCPPRLHDLAYAAVVAAVAVLFALGLAAVVSAWS